MMTTRTMVKKENAWRVYEYCGRVLELTKMSLKLCLEEIAENFRRGQSGDSLLPRHFNEL